MAINTLYIWYYIYSRPSIYVLVFEPQTFRDCGRGVLDKQVGETK